MKIKRILILNIFIIMLLFLTGCNQIGTIFINGGLVEKTMNVGDKIYLTTNVYTEEEVIWESTDVNIVTVDETGLVQAIAPGEANIIATVGESTNIVTIIVIDDSVSEITITGKQSVLVDETITLKASYIDPTATLVWSSKDTTIATVDQTGTVKGILPGLVTIRVSLLSDISVYKEVVVLVRTGNGIQDIINNYINTQTHITVGDLNLDDLNDTVVDLVKKVEKSVIGISAFENTDGSIPSTIGTGTGGIFKKEKIDNGFKYTVFTNHHVIEDSDYVRVYLGDLDEYVDAVVVKSDAEVDIAVVTFEHTVEYDVLEFETEKVEAGDFVVAIGNPGGYTYYGSVTFGMVSYPNRLMNDSDVVYVQHDTPINPGNSGGPLFNLDGKVVGINTLKIASSTTEGLGFSIALENFLDYIFN